MDIRDRQLSNSIGLKGHMDEACIIVVEPVESISFGEIPRPNCCSQVLVSLGGDVHIGACEQHVRFFKELSFHNKVGLVCIWMISKSFTLFEEVMGPPGTKLTKRLHRWSAYHTCLTAGVLDCKRSYCKIIARGVVPSEDEISPLPGIT